MLHESLESCFYSIALDIYYILFIHFACLEYLALMSIKLLWTEKTTFYQPQGLWCRPDFQNKKTLCQEPIPSQVNQCLWVAW